MTYHSVHTIIHVRPVNSSHMMHRTLEKHDPTKETLDSNYGIFIVNLYKFHKTVFLCLIGYLASVLYRFRAFIIIITNLLGY